MKTRRDEGNRGAGKGIVDQLSHRATHKDNFTRQIEWICAYFIGINKGFQFHGGLGFVVNDLANSRQRSSRIE